MHHGLLQISASAGSGKTYTLAKRYIMLLLFKQRDDGLLDYRRQTDYHSHILAITFTNKATTEMKKRIIDELYILATAPGESDFLWDFNALEAKMLDEQGKHCFVAGVLDVDKMQQAARQALASVLYEYGTFNVSTIDSFFQSILRNFARELDRDYNYEVQIDEKFALQTAIHNFLLSLGADARRHGGKYHLTDVERWVKAYISQQVSEGQDWNVFKEDAGLFKHAQLLSQEFFRQQMPRLHDYLTREQNGVRVTDLGKISEFKKRLIILAGYYEDQYKALGSGVSRLLDKHNVDIQCLYAGRFVQNMMNPDNRISHGEPYETGNSKTFTELTEEKLAKNCFKNKYVPPEAFVSDVMQWRGEVIYTYHAWQWVKNLAAELGFLGLLDRIDDNVKQYSRETNQLLIADTNDLIARVLDSGVPFLYERVGTWINHFMIDEFQDTSRKQYENFLPLLYEALARTDENLCMLIGDAKQSIYRFRNADPSLFRDQIGIDFSAERHGLHHEPLSTNYRSCPVIVRFNNWFFDQLLNALGQDPQSVVMRTYKPNGRLTDFQQKEHKAAPLGMVRVQFVSKSAQAPDKESEQVLQLLPEYLHELHRRFDWRDIGILVNRNTEGNDVVLRLMEYNKTVSPEQQISVASDESMLIANSPSVKRIVSLLRFVDLTQYVASDDDPDSMPDEDRRANRSRLKDQHMYHVLGLFMQRMAQDEAQAPGQVLEQCFRDTEALTMLPEDQQMDAYAREVDALLPDRRTELMTLPNIVEHIISRYMQDTQHVPQETAHLLAFQDCVNDFASQRSGGTVREFLSYWDTKSDKLTVPASSSNDAVSVITIHKSKGLEYDCVILPFANWEICSEASMSAKSPYWITREDLLAMGGDKVFAPDPEITQDMMPPLLPLAKKHVNVLAQHCGILRDYVETFGQNLMVDNMDKTYVAFTRPKQELHIFAKASSEIGKLLQPILEQGCQGGDVDVTKVDEVTYQWGNPRDVSHDKPKPQVDADVALIDMPPYQVASGASRISVRLPEDLSDKQNTGKRLHNLMSRIAYRRDVDRAWGFCVNRGIISDDDKEWPLHRLRAVIDGMFDDPRTSEWFSDDNRVYNERNLSAGHFATTTKRPDRVVCRPDGTWIVIDYKFGEKDLEKHTEQVRGYMKRLERMGKKPIQGYLWYVALDEIVPVNVD